jgi:leader peptidase (prepilin peptidase)/N-methyltransferase
MPIELESKSNLWRSFWRKSIKLLLVFAGVGAIFLICFWHFGLSIKAFSALIFIMVSLLLARIDLKFMLLPDVLTLGLLWLGLLFNLNGLWVSLSSAVLGAVLGYLMLFGVYWTFKFFTGKEGLGFGDLKLMAALGAWFGVWTLPLILLLASIFGLIFVGILSFLGKFNFKNRGTEFPFGPALLLAGVICLFLN